MGDVPVNVAHVVAGHVFAQLLEVHAAPLEAAQIRATHRVVLETVRADFDAADGFKEFGEGHGKNVMRQKMDIIGLIAYSLGFLIKVICQLFGV